MSNAMNTPTTAARAIDQSLRTGKLVTIEHDQFQFGLLCAESKDRDVMREEGARFWGIREGREWCVVMAPRAAD